ncbi:DUF5683 domain-containing protein [Halalkalibaculum sp. DA3122]|uniref:DUF5683 domain-containing protein n=1 Tax=Halalkalibaculum sp. DA3122 TaxID=3373607 RepID=UPI00375505B7
MAEKFASNIIQTKIWTGFSSYSNLFSVLLFCFILSLFAVVPATAQPAENIGHADHLQRQTAEAFLSPRSQYAIKGFGPVQPDTTANTENESTSRYPEPKSVLMKSLMIPGWGQLVNKQAWKIPLVYGLIGGVVGYNIYLTHRYWDYRAAYYNANNDDMRFGPTPDYIPPNTNEEQLRNTRNRLQNRRDLTYLGIVLAYGLNALDAYVYAHMRSFDVSEDLSLKTDLKPALIAESSPGITLSVQLFNHTK